MKLYKVKFDNDPTKEYYVASKNMSTIEGNYIRDNCYPTSIILISEDVIILNNQ